MDLKTATDDVRKLTRYFESLNGIVAVLDSVASIDQARNEAQQRLQAVLTEHGKVQQQIADKVGQLNDLNKRAAEAEQKIGENIETAKIEGARIITAAQAECDVERKRLAAQREDFKRAENDKNERLADLDTQIAQAGKALGEITAAMDEAKKIARAIAA